ncbi:MAG: hypothetical protein B6I20_12335 [Bacteroidetes bacterium 4572_117]|nr:MAG: hypothetical protein B6I20_12335 [Bacteroidetes bacterium 4572_117]
MEKIIKSKLVIIAFIATILIFGQQTSLWAISETCALLETPKNQVPDSLQKYTKTYKFINNDSFENFEVEYRGNIVVTPDDKDIQSISKNGFIKISMSSFGNKRRIYIYSDSRGKLQKEYYEGKGKKDFNKGGKEWLADILLDVSRKTGISAEERIRRRAKKGFEAILIELREIEEIRFENQTNIWIFYNTKTKYSQNVYYLYCKIITDNYRLKKNELYKFLKNVAHISSNSTKATILRNILDKYKFDKRLMNAFLFATTSLSYNTERGSVLRAFQAKYKINEDNSDAYFRIIDQMTIRTEKSNVLKPLLKNQKMDKATFLRFLKSVGRITSNSEKGTILYNALPLIKNDEQIIKAFIAVVQGMSSSYSNLKEDLLMNLAKENNGQDIELKKNKALLTGLLQNAQNFSTNTKKYILLRKVNRVFVQDKDLIIEYFRVIEGMDNEFLRYNVLLDLIVNNNLSGLTLYPFLDAVNQLIREDFMHASGAVLREFIKQLPEDEQIRNSFFETVDKIDLNSTREELLRNVCMRDDLSKEDLINIIKATDGIDVDVEKSSILLRVKPLIDKNDSESIFVFNTFAKKIELEYEFNKIADK